MPKRMNVIRPLAELVVTPRQARRGERCRLGRMAAPCVLMRATEGLMTPR